MPSNPEEPESSPGGDARLRTAVAAWVATADEPDERVGDADGAGADAGAEGGSASGRGGAGGDEPQAADAADDDEPADADPAPVAVADVDSGPDVNSKSDSDSATDSVSDADSEVASRAELDADADAGAAPKAGVDGPAGADAGSGSDAERSGGDVAGGSAGSEGSESDAVGAASASEGDSGSGRAAADADEPKAAETAEEPVEPDGSGESAGDDLAPVADAEGDRAVVGGDAPSGAGVDATSDREAQADEAPKDGAGSSAAPGRGDEPKADPDSDAGSSPSPSPSSDSSPSPSFDSDSGIGSERPKSGVDQHTAVFRAVRPGRPVDQPTTALKTVRPSAPVEPPESAAERTSTFVPLKPDGVRQAPVRKPEQKPEGSAPVAPAAPPAPPAHPVAAPAVAAHPVAAHPVAAPAAAAPAAAQAIPEAERTRQQPMPPRPPLDMLAELTNKPAPPETPTRTAVRRVKIWTPLLLLVVVLFAVAQFLRPLPAPALALTADPSYTFKGGSLDMPWPETGQSAVEVQGVGSIGTNGAQKSSPIASVAKVMTAYVILKEHPLKGREVGPKITVDALAEEQSKSPDESTAPIKEGQEFTEKQMLQLLMIPSGNNAARLLARWDAKSEDAFVKKMNDTAKDLGMKNSTYTDPSGFEKTTVSTATDQLKLAKAVMQYDVFRGIVDLPEVEIPGIDGKIYNNNNILLNPGVSGIKTGSTTPAGGNLVWAADTIIDGKKRRIVGAVMGQQTDGTLDAKLQLALTNSLKLIQAAQRDVTSATVVKKGEVVGYIDDGLGGRTPVVATKDLKAVGWPGLKVELAISDGGKTPPHAAKAGTEVGQLTVGTGPGQVKAPVALQKDLVEPAFGDKLTRIG
ncbi:serine hydrolase [Streptomyces sp. H27-C3]|uniref:D-alanyl-D-alanine carboxypeptidase family protein n=1 Tax=Streptomyces sp. H27-C3 TaxID=3046305 RepID=UPI0032D97436